MYSYLHSLVSVGKQRDQHVNEEDKSKNKIGSKQKLSESF